MKVLFVAKSKTLVGDKFKGMLVGDLVRYALKDMVQHSLLFITLLFYMLVESMKLCQQIIVTENCFMNNSIKCQDSVGLNIN